MTIHELTLAELGHLSRGRSRHRPRDAEFLYGGPYPFIQTGDVKKANFFVTEFSQTYSDAGLAQSKMWPAGTLCITIAANIAEVAILGIDACFPDSIIGFIADETICDRRYVKYWFDVYKRRFKQVAQGAAQDNLSQQKLLSFKLPLPEVAIQTRIADILFAYDGLIENNRRRIALLEQAAQQIYKEWFVRLHFPRHENTKFVDGLPEGWTVQPLSEIAAVNAQSLPTSFHGQIEYVDISSVSTGSINESTVYDYRDAPGRAKRVVKHGDIIWSCVRPNRRSHAIVWRPAPHLIVSTGFAVISPQTLPTSYIYQVVTSDPFVAYLESHAKGAAYPAVVAKDFEQVKVLVPANAVVESFDRITRPMIDQIQTLMAQNRKLAEARDLLLPRLMSGETEVT